MEDDTFAAFVQRERERMAGERQAIQSQQKDLQDKLDALDREMLAISAYETAKSGKAARAQSSAPRARRGSKRESILETIKNAPSGLSRGELLEAMGLKGNKAGEMSVSNALTNLTKTGAVDRREGRYHLAA